MCSGPGSQIEERNGEGYITSSDQENDVTLNKGDEKKNQNVKPGSEVEENVDKA